MKQSTYKTPKVFSNRKVSVAQASKILKRNGIQANEDEARIILNFLYLLAKTCSNAENSNR